MADTHHNKGNMKRRVHHLPLDGHTEIFDALDYLECNELIDFQTQNQAEDDCCSPSSLPFWMSRSFSEDDQSEDDGGPSSLPSWMSKSWAVEDQSEDDRRTCSLHFSTSNSSSLDDQSETEETDHENPPSFRFQTSSEGKKFIMDMVENMAESFYELSFRDIIDDDLASCGSVEDGDIIIEGDSLDVPKRVVKLPEIRKKNSSRDQIITKGQRVNTAVFLLKMFVPVSLRLKAKSKNPRKCSKVIPRTSFDGIENTLSKQLSKRLVKNKSNGIEGISQKRLAGGKFLSCFCKMTDSQRYIGNGFLGDGYNK